MLTTKSVKLTEDVQKELLKSFSDVADVIGSTMGPKGRYVAFHSNTAAMFDERGNLAKKGILLTKDGVTVSRQLNPEGLVPNLATKLCVDAANQTVTVVGDGTTTTVILVKELYQNCLSKMDDVLNVHRFVEGMKMASGFVEDYVGERATKIVDEHGVINVDCLKRVATIAANNNEKVGTMVSELVNNVGLHGMVRVEEGYGSHVEIEKKDGYVFDTGIIAPHFINNHARGAAVLENPDVIIVNEKIDSEDVMHKILNSWVEKYYHDRGDGMLIPSGKINPLVIIASDVEGPALATAIANLPGKDNRGVGIPMAIIKSPDFGERRRDMLLDIQDLSKTGRIFSKLGGVDIREFGESDKEEFGSVLRIESSGKQTIISFDNEDKRIDDRVKVISGQIESTEEESLKEFLKVRIAKMTSGVGVIRVGAETEVERRQLTDLIEDSQLSCFSAIRNGVVPGGGRILFEIGHLIPGQFKHNDIALGYQAVMETCREPFKWLVRVSGYDVESHEGAMLKMIFADDNKLLDDGFKDYTIDANDGRYDDGFNGVLDSAHTPVVAIKKSVSVISQLISTGYLVEVNHKVG